ncbi:MAG: hypothetical protein KJ799_13455 [Bacteroidetes bacterium]|nr:hypothetical protein [Bacteroidota bacterium]MBU2507713.1 hypothetical protein [Bacteroidota bacterium]
MAKQQTFADKAKKKERSSFITVKYVKTVKSEKGSYKFQEKLVKLDDINKVTSLK